MSNNFFSFFSKKEVPSVEINTLTPEMFSFLSQFPTAILLLDATGKIAFANASAATLLHSKVSSLTGAKVDRFGLTMPQVRTMAEDKAAKKVVIQLVNRDADAVFVSAGASNLASTPFIMLTFEAVPLFKQLTAEKNFLSSLLDGYPCALALQNFAGVCTLWNNAAAKLFGHKSADVTGKSIYDFLPKEIIPSVKRVDEQVRTKLEPREGVQLTYRNTKGEERALCVSKTLVKGDNGKPQFILTSFEDCTERRNYEQDLLQNRTLLRAVLDNVPLGLYTRDCDNEMTFYNRQSMTVLGETDAKCVNTPHPYQDKNVVAEHHIREQEVLKEGKIQDYPSEEYVDHHGNKKILHLIKVPLMDAGPKPLVLSIVEDITERRQQEEKISRMNSILSAILQNAPIGLYARGEDGTMWLRNKKCCDIFGEKEEAFSLDGALPHETPDQVSQYITREHDLLKQGKTLDIPEEEYVLGSGEKKLLHMIKVPITGTNGEPNMVITLAEDITQKKEQEKALIENKNFLQTLLDQVPVAIYSRGVDKKISYVNRRALELFPDENPEKEDPFYIQREDSIFHDGKMVEFPEEWYTTKRGEKILLHLIKAPVFDKEGKPFMVLTVAEDITQKKAQEKAIVNARNFLQTVINNLPVSLSVKDYDGKYILWNKKAEEIFGALAKDVIGKTSYRADLNKDQAEFVRESDLRVFDNKREQNIPQELISTATEGVKIMHTVKTPLFNEDGTPNCLLSVSEDITAKTRMEKQIREASDKNTLLVENAREGIAILEDGKIIYANRALCSLLGYEDLAAVKGKALLDLAVEDHRLFLKDKYDAVVAGADDASSAIDLRMIKKNGAEIEAEFAAVASTYLGRRIVLGFVRDVTGANRTLREVKNERANFRAAFEKCVTPAFILSHKGYISVMNESCRSLFALTEADKNFYRNVYIKPAISLSARKLLRAGQPAQMDYTFDFDRAARQFPGRVKGTGKMSLSVSFVPINKRDAKDGSIEADYVVFLEPKKQHTPLPPAPPVHEVITKTPQEMLVLPNSEPYALCKDTWQIDVCNDLFSSLCQRPLDGLTGKDIRSMFDEESRKRLETDLKDLLQDGTLVNREYHILLGNGPESTAVRLTAIKETDGRYLFVFRNMAFHRQIMKILEERSAQLNALLEATDGVVFTVLFENGRFGHIEQAGKPLAHKLGFSQDELVHKNFADLFDDKNRGEKFCASVLARAQEELALQGKTSFKLPVRRKDGTTFEAQTVLTALDMPGKDSALVVVHDLSEQMDRMSKDSKEAQELKSVRQALPGLYLKTDNNGRVLEVYSNLDYLNNQQAAELFLDKKPAEYWPEEAAGRALFAIKESLSINVSSNFEFSWTVPDKLRHFEASVTPISGRDEAVLWVKDVSNSHAYDEQIHELYHLTSEPGLSITDQVNKVLAFGLKAFRADVGLVLRFEQGKLGLESHVVYVTKNDFHLERHMEFPVEECLIDVPDGNVVMFPDLGNASCEHCLHKEKNFGSLAAAPLYVGGKVQGALCFASRASRRSFDDGAEELLGIMARLLGLRIELRQTGKQLGEASRSLARTLEYVEMPAAIIDLDYQTTFVNNALLQTTGKRIGNMLGHDFFATVIRNDDLSKRMFKSAENSAAGNAFQVRMDLLHENGLYQDTAWDVYACKNSDGEIDGYALIASGN